MPIFDFPLPQLRAYTGRNPRPADFDSFWDAAVAEMKSVAPKVELVPHKTSSRTAECFDLYFTGVGGSRLYAKYLRPKAAAKPHPAVLLFHGYTVNSGDWFDKFAWVSQGYAVAALDCRGQGGKSQDLGGVTGNTMRGQIIRGLDDPPEKLLFRQIYLDTAQLANIVMQQPEVDPKRVGATGGSQGGGLTLACAALEPRIKRAAPVYPFLCDYQRVWEMDLAGNAYEELRAYFRQFDPRHERETEIFTKLGYIDCQHLAPRIRAEVLMSVGLMDQICPPSTQFAAYNKITAKKDMVIYPDYAHEGMPGVNDTIFEFMSGL
jgi:cephalosporin-C deacetylase